VGGGLGGWWWGRASGKVCEGRRGTQDCVLESDKWLTNFGQRDCTKAFTQSFETKEKVPPERGGQES